MPERRRQLRLTDRAKARGALARIIRDYDAGPAEPSREATAKFRATVHALATLLAYDRAAEELALGERLERLEALL